MSGPRIVLVDDEPDLRWVLRGLFEDEGFQVAEAGNGEEALAEIGRTPPDVVLSDVRMAGMHGLELLAALQRQDRELPVVLLSAVEDLATAVDAMRQGAFDYQAKPFDQERLVHTVHRATERYRLVREVRALKDRLGGAVEFGSSERAAELERTLELVAPQTGLALLLIGESGTGKEVVAREIHRRSPLADGPFVAVDCGALPEALMESQLFGHKRGAFTGADRDRPGLFRMADGGTLFLDEIGNLPLGLQAKLLRALQERAVVPVGGGEPLPFSARLLCATNSSLSRQVEDGGFRMDLYHRIAEFTLNLPPLRERPEDVVHFAGVFLEEANREMGRRVEGFTDAALAELRKRPWQGNLRELRNAIRRGVLLCADSLIGLEDLCTEEGAATPVGALPRLEEGRSLVEQVRRASEEVEAHLIAAALERTSGNKAEAARLLRVDYTTLHRKLKRYAGD